MAKLYRKERKGEGLTLWTRVKVIEKLFPNIPPGNFLGGRRFEEGVLFLRPPPMPFSTVTSSFSKHQRILLTLFCRCS